MLNWAYDIIAINVGLILWLVTAASVKRIAVTKSATFTKAKTTKSIKAVEAVEAVKSNTIESVKASETKPVERIKMPGTITEIVIGDTALITYVFAVPLLGINGGNYRNG